MLECAQYIDGYNRINRKRIKCVIRYRDGLYVIYRDVDNQDVLISVQRHIYCGFKQTMEIVEGKILDIAQKILDKHESDAQRYPLCGEWYEICEHRENGRIRYGVRKIKPARATSRVCYSAVLLQMIVAMVLVFPTLVLTYSFAKEWLHVLMPMLDLSAIGYIYAACVCVCCVLLFLLFKTRRSVICLFYNTVIPFGLIAAAGMLKQHWWMWLVIPTLMLIGFILSKFLIEYFCTDEEDRGERIRSTLILCGLVLFCICAFGGVRGYLHEGIPVDFTDMTAEQAREEYQNVCRNLDPEIWDTLTVEQKANVLRAVSDYECVFVLGCEPVEILVGVTSGKDTLGSYSHSTRSILLNTEHVREDEVYDVLNTVFHESRHAYQHAIVDMYLSVSSQIDDSYSSLIPIKQARIYYRELNDYCNPNQDLERYYGQEIEKDSRAWAEKRLNEYYEEFLNP